MNELTGLMTGVHAGAVWADIGGHRLPLHYGDPTAEYSAARTGAVIMDRSHEGRVRVTGRDRIDLLHRMSTNDLSGMGAGEARMTVLTNALARMVDAVWVLALPGEAIVITSPGRARAVRRWLSGYVFFQDDVQFGDANAELGQLEFHGPKAATVATAFVDGAASLAAGTLGISGSTIVARVRALAGDGFTLIAPVQALPGLWERALSMGAVPAGDSTYHALRVEAGQPYGGHEITEEYIPLEAGLWPAVSFTKGCYIGQEIIARMESRGRLARTLVGLKLSAPVNEGAELRHGSAPVGRVTTVARSPATGDIALGIVKPAQAEPGNVLDIGGVRATVAEFPLA